MAPEKKIEIEFKKVCVGPVLIDDPEQEKLSKIPKEEILKTIKIGTNEGLGDVFSGGEPLKPLEIKVDIDAITLYIQSSLGDSQEIHEEDIFYFEPYYMSKNNLSEPKIFGLDPTRDYISNTPRDFLIVFNCIEEGQEELDVLIPLDDNEDIAFKVFKDCAKLQEATQNSVK